MEANIRSGLFEALASALAVAFEAMTGDKPAIQWEGLDAPSPGAAAPEDLEWRQAFEGLPGFGWAHVHAAVADWTSLAQQILRAGLEDSDAESDAATLTSTYLELLGRWMAVFAERLTARAGRDVICGLSDETPAHGPGIQWALMRLSLQGASAVEISMGLDQALLDAIESAYQHGGSRHNPNP